MTEEKKDNILTGAAIGAVGVPAFGIAALESDMERLGGGRGWGELGRFNPRTILLWTLFGGALGAATGAVTDDVIDFSSKTLKQLGFKKHEQFIH